MKEEFATYLQRVGVVWEQPLYHKAERLLTLADSLCPEQPETIFISDFTKEGGSRELLSLWMFTQRYTLEAKEFSGARDMLDVTYLWKTISYVEVEYKDYSFKEASDGSRLTVSINFTHAAGGGVLNAVLRASKKNCDALWNVYLKHLKPNLLG
jgi:hypothetical protein